MNTDVSSQIDGSRIEDARIFNRRLVFETIFQRGPISRVEISGLVRLKPQTISSITRELLDQGLIIEAGRSSGLRGQPQIYLDANAAAGFSIGIHLDRGQVLVKVCDLKRSEVTRRDLQVDTRNAGDALSFIAISIGDILGELGIGREKVWGVGVVLPTFGSSAYDFDFSLPDWDDWRDVSVAERLQQLTGLAVYTENDATAAAIGERFHRHDDPAADFCYIYIGNGTGAGLIVDGMPFKGARGNSGEVGLLPVFGIDGSPAWPERETRDILSIGGLRQAVGAADDATAMAEAERLLKLRDHRLMQWMDAAAAALRDITAIIEVLFDPEFVVAGGLLPRPVVELLVEHAYPLRATPAARRDRQQPRLTAAALIKDAAVTGAAMLPIFVNTNPNFRHLYVRQIPQDVRPIDGVGPAEMS
ncbi:ROK family protein [Oryzibacter oryziterrae]|uniref:ROK family protein n=1 Tax=Oryzibacter oryziterrae TaxID=2766474 RepID=UPI001F20E985|nr:ROK family protein [Oryzibacter oryziterrae]